MVLCHLHPQLLRSQEFQSGRQFRLGHLVVGGRGAVLSGLAFCGEVRASASIALDSFAGDCGRACVSIGMLLPGRKSRGRLRAVALPGRFAVFGRVGRLAVPLAKRPGHDAPLLAPKFRHLLPVRDALAQLLLPQPFGPSHGHLWIQLAGALLPESAVAGGAG